MPKVPYPKQIQAFANQIGILKQRGMTFADEAAAETWLRRVSYYRMSGYWYPLLADRVNHTFKPGATFEQAVSLYEALHRGRLRAQLPHAGRLDGLLQVREPGLARLRARRALQRDLQHRVNSSPYLLRLAWALTSAWT